MTDEEKVTEKKNKVQPEENIERLKKIRQKRTSGVSMKYMAGAGAAVAVVIVVAVAGGVLGKSGESRAGRIKVETVEASLETTAPRRPAGNRRPLFWRPPFRRRRSPRRSMTRRSRRSWTVMQTWGSPGYPAI